MTLVALFRHTPQLFQTIRVHPLISWYLASRLIHFHERNATAIAPIHTYRNMQTFPLRDVIACQDFPQPQFTQFTIRR